MDSNWRPQSPLPAALPVASAHLYGYVDTSVKGHRAIKLGATTYTLAVGYYRGDALATALTTAGASTTYANGRFTVTPGAPDTLESPDRLAVALGLLSRAGQQLASAASHTSQVISPVAIPLYGVKTQAVVVDADDVMTMSRQNRVAGYAWGAVRVYEATLYMHRWSLEALRAGWCMKGQVALVGAVDSPVASGQPGGSIIGQVLSVGRPEWDGPAELGARVVMRIAVGV